MFTLARLDLQDIPPGVTHVVASSFAYERYYRGAELPGQADYIYRGHAQYEQLFSLPYVEIRPQYMSFAFSNPTIRIVDIRPLRDAAKPSG